MHLWIVDHNHNAGAVGVGSHALVIGIFGIPVAVAIIVEVLAALAPEQVDSGVTAMVQSFKPAIAKTKDRLLEAPTKIAPPSPFTSGQWAVRATIAKACQGLLPGHAFGLICHHQHGAILMPLVFNVDNSGNRFAQALQACLTVVAVG